MNQWLEFVIWMYAITIGGVVGNAWGTALAARGGKKS